MIEHVNGRPLTAQEQAWRATHRCIWCGAKVEPRRLRRASDGKWEWTYPYSCEACARTQRRTVDAPPRGRDWGAARASAASQGPREMGYHLPRDGGGPEMGNDGDD